MSAIDSGPRSMRCLRVSPGQYASARNGSPLPLADFVNAGKVGMVQRTGCLGLAQKPTHRVGVVRRRPVQELEGDLPFEVNVLGQIHFAHPACAKQRLQAEMAYCRTEVDPHEETGIVAWRRVARG